MPKASVVIPVYDGDYIIAETLESLRNQTEKDIEIIVVNDASPDYTPDLMEWYVKQDPRIKFYHLETNHGVCYARNYGNEKAESEILFVSDQDDLSLPNRVEVSLAFMDAHPEIDCITSAYQECNVEGHPVKEFTPEDMTRELFERGNFTWFHSSACYRKKDILELPYREVQGATDDWVFIQDWLSAGKKFKTLPEVLGLCRRLPGGVMSQRRAVMGLQPNYVL
jgi:glycosyltransferase involved in cell wall biosynthesis